MYLTLNWFKVMHDLNILTFELCNNRFSDFLFIIRIIFILVRISSQNIAKMHSTKLNVTNYYDLHRSPLTKVSCLERLS